MYPSTCAAIGCGIRSGTNALSEVRMFAFPKNVKRGQLWIAAVRRQNWKPNSRSRLCNRHFITGRPSTDPQHPDYVPSIFSFSKEQNFQHAVDRYERQKKRNTPSSTKKGQPSKDPKHPDYTPSVFVFSKNVEEMKKSFSKMKKKLDCPEAESSENATNHNCTGSTQGKCVSSPCVKGFCTTCFSPEYVSSAFNMSLAPLNQTLEQLSGKLNEMEAEREQLYSELASCRAEIHQLREAHQECEVRTPSTKIQRKQRSLLSGPSSHSKDASELLETIYNSDDDDDETEPEVDDPDIFPPYYMEQSYLQLSEEANQRKRIKKSFKAAHGDKTGIREQYLPPKEKRMKRSLLKVKDTSESSKGEKSTDSGSPITIVYLKP